MYLEVEKSGFILFPELTHLSWLNPPFLAQSPSRRLEVGDWFVTPGPNRVLGAPRRPPRDPEGYKQVVPDLLPSFSTSGPVYCSERNSSKINILDGEARRRGGGAPLARHPRGPARAELPGRGGRAVQQCFLQSPTSTSLY